jgi:hypothetical protein
MLSQSWFATMSPCCVALFYCCTSTHHGAITISQTVDLTQSDRQSAFRASYSASLLYSTYFNYLEMCLLFVQSN